MTAVPTMSSAPRSGLIALYRKAVKLPERLPLSVVQLAARVAVAHVFWQSAQSKLASWPVTLQLFAAEYQLPLIPPELAAPLATTAEITGAVLLLFGVFARFGALILLGVITTIQIFVYPGSWAEHLLWASLLLLILSRGAGAISLDAVAQHLLPERN
ncbi:DoxX [Hartmannibacter diazotrophicus]|uniref:DoxX n=1 Tax=Hartmannibacter diazotrophicus TaxID=1482074 RepID=A0A2C9DC44_9HYPH|nr:DoxX family protein [Hartmannibacter diazotrophicus]SON57749.1 DoxX [Hartmannibacter diazotrophicus]